MGHSAISRKHCLLISLHSSVGIATGYGAGQPRDRSSSPSRVQELSLLYIVQTDSGAQPASYPMGTGEAISRAGVKRPGREADH
jgi:hypothetical protein